MKRFFLGLFVFIDLGLIGGAGFVLYGYVAHKGPAASLPTLAKPAGLSPVSATPVASPAGATALKPSGGGLFSSNAASESATRKIKFTYRNPKAHKVFIRADFTGWKAQPMDRDANGVWTFMAPLTPGEYAYCYTADDRTFKDPANKRTKVIGRTTVSAILVEALPSKTAK